ncbi:MAG: hypothetical protein IMZ52_00335 [Actinobacteria bacterium]|nr:hypothetical protein [Actinomycetota bacterium]
MQHPNCRNLALLFTVYKPSYEADFYGEIQGKKCLIYQLEVTNKNNGAIIKGIVKSDFENNLEEIKKLARTIQLR